MEHGKKLMADEVEGRRHISGFERCCLNAHYRLYKADVERLLPTDDQKDAFTARLREKGLGGELLREICKVLGVRRVK
jgi:hypothetical protein